MRSSSILLVARCIFKIFTKFENSYLCDTKCYEDGLFCRKVQKIVVSILLSNQLQPPQNPFLIFSPSLSSMSNPFCQLRLTGWGTEI